MPVSTEPMPSPVAFVWESFGPTHHDRLRALASGGFTVDAIELSSTSKDYQWERGEACLYDIHTLGNTSGGGNGLGSTVRLVRTCLKSRARHFFLCHYGLPSILVTAWVLRLFGRRVFTLLDSKFDDYPRTIWREFIKAFYLLPYNGAIVASDRSRDYLSFLGLKARPIEMGYDTIDISRIKALTDEGAVSIPFADRPFLVVARLVPKKNIAAIIEAFAMFLATTGDARRLRIVGYGPMEAELRDVAARLGVGDVVDFVGGVDSARVALEMRSALALVLASTEEQFGLVVNEALANGLPVIVSSNAGAVDVLVENLGNGIVINPCDINSIVLALQFVAGDEVRWRAMCERALETAPRGDAALFTESVHRLVRAKREI